MEKHHSCLNTRAIIEYFQKHHPDQVPALFTGLGEEIDTLEHPQEFLMNVNNWVSSEVVAKMFDNARRLTGDDRIAFKIGFEASAHQKFGYVQRIFILAAGSPRRAVKKVQEINNKFSRNKVIEILYIRRQSAAIRIHWLKHIPASPDFCLFNQGIYTGIPPIWGLPPMSVEETKCFFRGDPFCEYHGVWEKKAFFKRTFQKLFMPWRLLRDTIEELERDKELLSRKFDEVHHLNVELKKKIDQLMSLPETCVAALSVLTVEGLLQATLRILTNFARLDRAGIFLLDETETQLEAKYAVGIEPEVFKKLRDYKVPLTKVDNILARAAVLGLPVVIPEVATSKINLENPLIQALKPKSFLVTPLSVRGKVLGVLVADRLHQEGAITDMDKDVIMSFANQLAIALDNALLHRKLEVTEQRYRELVENAHEGIWIIDEGGQIKFANRRLKEITGYDDLEGRSIYELFDRDNKMLLMNTLAQNQKGKVIQNEITLTAKNQNQVMVLMSSVPILENKQYVGAFAMFNDITEMKRMEKQLIEAKKMEAITSLSEGIAHNFNDILMNIMGLTGLLLADAEVSRLAYGDLKQIEQEVLKGAELTKQLLAMSEGSEVDLQPLEVNFLVDKVVKLFRQAHQGVTVTLDLTPRLPEVRAHPAELEQALMNLLVFAAEAAGGQGELELTTEEVLLGEEFCQLYGRRPGHYIYLQISTATVSNVEQTRARIFEPFLGAPRITPSSALKVTSVYAIVKNHQGIILVDADKDSGTTFHLYLPVTKKLLAPERTPTYRYVRGSGTILLVDDDESVRQMEARMLERLGYRVLATGDGQQALSLYQERTGEIDLVILDMVMPEMSGKDIYHRLKQINPQAKVMLYSGHSMDQDVYELLEEGAVGYIQKPYSLSEFSKKIADVLNLPAAKLDVLPTVADMSPAPEKSRRKPKALT